jgi:(1->4)-alpha-D-glucan 1-alpha-D-glucosylmutase
LERGELKLVFENGGFRVDYWDQPLPISPATYPLILRLVDERLEGQIVADDLDLLELRSVRTALERLDSLLVVADPADLDAQRATWRQEQTLAKHRLNALCERSPLVDRAVSDVVAEMNGVSGDSATFDALDELLHHQHYRLSSWRVAAEEINYRRFFAINSLAAIRQEVPDVFEDSHGFLATLVANGQIDGLRIDHPDGLWDPAGYFRSLQRLVIEAAVRRRLDHGGSEPLSDDEWAESRTAVRSEINTVLDRLAPGDRWPLHVVAEKILEHGETLRDDWAIAGTVGYEFAQAATGVFVDGDHRQLFDRLYAQYTGDRIRFHDLVYDMKQRMMHEAFASEVNVLANELNRLSERDRHVRDFTLNNLRDALREILACFSVYRTYTTTAALNADDRDRRYIESAVSQAKRRNPAMDMSVFDFVARVMLNAVPDDPSVPSLTSRNLFTMRLQQLSGPVMAKGLEDTAFYRFNRLVSLNEVGGDPSRFGMAVEEFHRQNRARRRSWPTAMINSSTHDTKRAEDVRARINVLSEIPVEWRAALGRWSRANRKLKRRVEGVLAPRRADEYVLYQTLVGTWPLREPDADGWERYVTRIQEYVVKVGREANRFTNWVNPDEAYEAALTGFVAGFWTPGSLPCFRPISRHSSTALPMPACGTHLVSRF